MSNGAKEWKAKWVSIQDAMKCDMSQRGRECGIRIYAGVPLVGNNGEMSDVKTVFEDEPVTGSILEHHTAYLCSGVPSSPSNGAVIKRIPSIDCSVVCKHDRPIQGRQDPFMNCSGDKAKRTSCTP